MALSKKKMALRKALEKQHRIVKVWTRQDLTIGKWFRQYLDLTLGSYANASTPDEIKKRHPGVTEPEKLVETLINVAVHDAIRATDAGLSARATLQTGFPVRPSMTRAVLPKWAGTISGCPSPLTSSRRAKRVIKPYPPPEYTKPPVVAFRP